MRVSDSAYAVTGLGFTPPWEVNAGFVTGREKTLVVDTGPTYLAARTIYGYALAAAPSNAMIAVNLELHVDHLMGNSFFQEMSVPIWGHEKCMRTPDALASNIREYNETIPDPARREGNEAEVFFRGSRIVNPTHPISRVTSFELGGVEAAAIPAPGHTQANLLVHVPAEGVLFTGDTVTADYAPNLESGGPAEWTQWLSSLEVIRSLAPRILIPGHGRVLTGGEIAEQIHRVEEMLRDAIAAERA